MTVDWPRAGTATARALYGAYFRGGWNCRTAADYQPGVVHRSGGRSVTMASRFRPYMVSRHGNGRHLHHRTRAVFVAWWHGRPVGQLVIGWCGTKLITAELVDDPGRVCPLCDLRERRRAEAA